jgi:hypothetical protein
MSSGFFCLFPDDDKRPTVLENHQGKESHFDVAPHLVGSINSLWLLRHSLRSANVVSRTGVTTS